MTDANFRKTREATTLARAVWALLPCALAASAVLWVPGAAERPLPFLLIAVLLASGAGGIGSGLACAIGSAGMIHFFAEPRSLLHETATVAALALAALITGSIATAMRRARAREASSTALLRATLHSIGEGVVVTDESDRVLSMNPAAERLLEVVDASVIGRPFLELVPLEEPVECGDPATRCCVLRRRGSAVAVECVESALRDEHGAETGSVYVLRDVSERLQAELRQMESRQEFADLFQNAPAAIHWIGADGTLLRVNRKEAELLGYSAEELIGRHVQEFHAEPELAEHMLALLRGGAELEEFPARLRRRDGCLIDVRVNSSVLRRDGRFVHARCFTRDVTAQLQAEQAMRDAQQRALAASRAKDEFLAVLSHELRTPLTPVILAVDELVTRADLDEATRAELDVIRRNLHLEVRLIDDLLDVNRIVRGKLVLERRPVDMHQLIENVARICRSMALEKLIDVSIELDAERMHTRGDPARLQQSLWNLVRNALQYTPEGGRVAIRTLSPAPGRLVVEVADNGVGIEAEEVDRIFRRFEQGRAGMAYRTGLGLGLAITTSLIEAHGGRVSVASAGRNQGATFTVELPVLEAAPAAAEPSPAAPAAVQGRRARILLIEDHADTALLLARLLRGNGYNVTTAGDLAAASRAVQREEFDLIISDISLPDGSGIDFMAELRRSRAVPAIALTGHGRDTDVAESAAAGFEWHMTKPIDFSRLLGVVQGALQSRVSAQRAGG